MDTTTQPKPVLFLSKDGAEAMTVDDMILTAIGTGKTRDAILGRAIAAGFGARLTAWLEAEAHNGTDMAEAFTVMLDMQLQVAASIAGNLFTASADQPVADAWARIIKDRFAQHAQTVRRARQLYDENTEQAG